MEIGPIQESLLAVLPYWNYRISRPFKHLLDDGVSVEMYYCLQIMRGFDEALTMSELGQRIQMSKQQLTRIVNRLEEHGFVRRLHDPSNRRSVRLQITEEALDYIERFLHENAECFRDTIGNMDETDQADFKRAIDILARILSKLPRD